MAKKRTVFSCQQCGSQHPRWLGRCPECGEWDSLVEEVFGPVSPSPIAAAGESRAERLADVQPLAHPRFCTGIGELDRVLGGGLVSGSVVLIGGDPGIGKSTLLLQACHGLSRQALTPLYVTGEESLTQMKLRAERLGVDGKGILAMSETNADVIAAHIQSERPDLAVIDSIQMVHRPDVSSAPGSVSQVRDSAALLVQTAKATGVAVALIGHVTKQGVIAGPRILEHMVDTVLYFEGDAHHTYRLLRAVKNRFGPTNELGVFEMRSSGLAEVTDLTGVFVSRQRAAAPGSVVVPTIEGTRALLVEVQALVTRATYGTPERKVSGMDRNRVAMLLAVIEKRAGLALADHDVFVNAVGGVRIVEPAADLAVAVAIASSFVDKPISSELVAIGEVGLAGEVRGVPQMDARLREAAKLGATRALVPRESAKAIREKHKGLHITHAATLADALDAAFS
ncbi:DNA repair protein RadA [bacterium]|nr:DNA repair protein RadA [bacterium]